MSYPADPRPPAAPGGAPSPGRSRAPFVVAIAAIVVLVAGGVLAVVLVANDSPEPPCSALLVDGCTPPTDDTTSGQPTETTQGGESTYCEKMGLIQTQFTNLQAGSMSDDNLNDMVTGLQELKPIAPNEVTDDFDTFVSGMQSVQDLLDELDITFEQFQDPEFLTSHAGSWTPDQRQQIVDLSTKLSDPAFTAAGTAIDEDFRSRC